MSQENVEIVRTVQLPSGTELTDLYTDEARLSGLVEAAAPFFADDFEFEAHAATVEPATGSGVESLLAAWREWLKPFKSFRTEVEEVVDVDDQRVLVLIRDHPRPYGTDAEIESLGCSLWTLRDRKIARIDFYPTRSQGLAAAGLSD